MTTTPRRSTAGRATLEMVAELAGVSRGTASRVLSGAPNVSDARGRGRRTRPPPSCATGPTCRRAVAGHRAAPGWSASWSTRPTTRCSATPTSPRVARGAHAALVARRTSRWCSRWPPTTASATGCVDLAALRLDGLLVVHGHGDPQLVESLVGRGRRRGVRRAHEHRRPRRTSGGSTRDNASGAARRGRAPARPRPPADRAPSPARATWSPARTASRAGAIASRGGRGRGRRPPSSSRATSAPSPGRVGDGSGCSSAVPDLDARVRGQRPHGASARCRCCATPGATVPDDVAVVGFDDIEAASHASPPLTTVAQDVERASAAAMAELLLEQLGGAEPSPVREVILPTDARRPRLRLTPDAPVRPRSPEPAVVLRDGGVAPWRCPWACAPGCRSRRARCRSAAS